MISGNLHYIINVAVYNVQLELDCSIGCVNIHLSPHLVHLLLEIASGLSSPGTLVCLCFQC